jgi:hypothetical protein
VTVTVDRLGWIFGVVGAVELPGRVGAVCIISGEDGIETRAGEADIVNERMLVRIMKYSWVRRRENEPREGTFQALTRQHAWPIQRFVRPAGFLQVKSRVASFLPKLLKAPKHSYFVRTLHCEAPRIDRPVVSLHRGGGG